MEQFSISVKDYLKKLMAVGNFVRAEKSSFSDSLDYLKSKNFDFVLIGGLATSHYSPPRLTEDIDIFLENEQKLEEFKRLSLGEVKWIRKHAFICSGIEVEVLTPEFLSIPSKISDYVFSTKVEKSSGLFIPSPEGVLLLKLEALRDFPDKQDIYNIIKTQGQSLDLEIVKSLTSEKGRLFLDEVVKNLKIFLEDRLEEEA
jgi:hypothetical protein